jgi:hypothetical protein
LERVILFRITPPGLGRMRRLEDNLD